MTIVIFALPPFWRCAWPWHWPLEQVKVNCKYANWKVTCDFICVGNSNVCPILWPFARYSIWIFDLQMKVKTLTIGRKLAYEHTVRIGIRTYRENWHANISWELPYEHTVRIGIRTYRENWHTNIPWELAYEHTVRIGIRTYRENWHIGAKNGTCRSNRLSVVHNHGSEDADDEVAVDYRNVRRLYRCDEVALVWHHVEYGFMANQIDNVVKDS